MLDLLWEINRGLAHRFSKGNEPFQIMTRLLEEVGELAKEVNHFEDTGIKREKYGPPDPAHLALEVKHVLLLALQVAKYYGVEEELNQSIQKSYDNIKAERWLD